MQTDLGQVKQEIKSINNNMAGLQSVQQQGFTKIETMLTFISSVGNSAPPLGAASADNTDTQGTQTDEPLQITPDIHDELVELLSLNTGSPLVVRARPTAGCTRSFPRWLGLILSSKRQQNWIEVLRQMGHDDNVLAALGDMDSIFEFIVSRVEPKSLEKGM